MTARPRPGVQISVEIYLARGVLRFCHNNVIPQRPVPNPRVHPAMQTAVTLYGKALFTQILRVCTLPSRRRHYRRRPVNPVAMMTCRIGRMHFINNLPSYRVGRSGRLKYSALGLQIHRKPDRSPSCRTTEGVSLGQFTEGALRTQNRMGIKLKPEDLYVDGAAESAGRVASSVISVRFLDKKNLR